MAKAKNSAGPMRLAIRKDDANAVRALINKGFEVNAPLPTANTFTPAYPPLVAAAMQRRIKVMGALLDAGANPNKGYQGWTPLMACCLPRHHAGAKLLLEHGADVNALCGGGDRGGTALMCAAAEHDSEMVRLFIAAGADAAAVTRHGRSAINFAVARNRNKCLPVLRILLDAGCRAGAASLGWPMIDGNVELIRILIGAGADVNAASTNLDGGSAGWTPLGRAVLSHGLAESMRKSMKQMGRAGETDKQKARWLAVIKELLAAGADPSLPSNVGSALAIATRNNDVEVLALFPKAGKTVRVKEEHPPRAASPRKAKPAPAKRTPPKRISKSRNSGSAGARDFLEFVYQSEPEWAVLIVQAPLDATIKALQKHRRIRHWEKRVPLKLLDTSGQGDGVQIDEIPVVALKQSDWTIVLRSMFHISGVELRELPQDAAALSKSLKTRAATFMGEDTSSAMGYELHDRGRRVELIDWAGGRVSRFESSLRKQPRWPADDFDIADAIFRDLGVYLPCCLAESDDADAAYLAADKKSAERIARADLITL